METNYEHRSQLQDEVGELRQSSSTTEPQLLNTETFVAPGVPIVRSNTPRPILPRDVLPTNIGEPHLSHQSDHPVLSTFPSEAPPAPPLPEEIADSGDTAISIVESTPLPLSSGQAPPEEISQEFLWLFEYGQEMDITVLNSPTNLDGSAFFYGPAVLKGYRIAFDAVRLSVGHVTPTIVPSREYGTEVWGVLYRIPRRLAVSHDGVPSLLDTVHAAVPPDGLFTALQVTVYDTYREREIISTTYIASAAAHEQFRQLLHDQQEVDPSYIEHLLEIARKQKLPDAYIQELTRHLSSKSIPSSPPPITTVGTTPTPEQHTELLSIMGHKQQMETPRETDTTKKNPSHVPLNRFVIVFALYLILLLLVALTLAILQGLGFGNRFFTATFTPVGVPWFVLFYGFLGACVSSLITLARRTVSIPPLIVLTTWFARPFVGMVFAMLAYLLVNSGLFTMNLATARSGTVFSLLGLFAGLCEGWIFCKPQRHEE